MAHFLLYKKNFLNVVSIYLRQRNASFYAYYPFNPQGQPNSVDVHGPRDFSELFGDKAKNLHKNSIKILQYPNPPFTQIVNKTVYGLDVGILGIIEQKLNATFDIHITAGGRPAFPEDIHDMYKGNYISICIFPVQLTNHPFVIHEGQLTYPFWQVNTNIVTLRKKATYISFFASVCNPASGVFLAAVLLIYLIYRATKGSNSPTATPLDIFGVVLLASLPFYPGRSLTSAILINLSVLALIYVTIIQSSLTSFIISPRAKQIETIRQFAEEGYKIYMLEHTNAFALEKYPNLFVNFTDLSSVRDILMEEYLKIYPKMGTLTLDTYFGKDMAYSQSGELHLVPEPIRRGWLTYKLPVHSPFYDIVNEISFRIFEGGLIEFLQSPTFVQNRIFVPLQMAMKKSSLIHLSLAMFPLVFGLSMAGLMFLGELGWAKRQRKRAVVK